jgi:hypothetical protein
MIGRINYTRKNSHKEAHIVRKAISRAALVGGSALAVVVAMALPAGAALVAPTPAPGALVTGTVSLYDNGANSVGCNDSLGLSTASGSTNIFVDQGTGTSVTTVVASGTADSGSSTVYNAGTVSSDGTSSTSNQESGSWVTDNFGNGAYTINSTEKNTKSTFGLICGSGTTTNAKESVTVNNAGAITYGSATSAPEGTSIAVKATLVDENGVAIPNGATVSFALTGGTTVTATTAGGVAQTTLPIAGPPRSTNLAVSYAGGYFTAATQNVTFNVTQVPTTTTLSPTTSTDFGQTASFTASVASQDPGEPAPTGTIQFTADGNNIGSPVTISGGSASITDNALAAGNHSIGAIYSGDSNFFGSSATSQTQVVAPAPTSTAVVTTVTPSAFGQSVQYTATVTATSPGGATGAPAGTVSFSATPNAGGSAIPVGGAVTLTASGTNSSTASSITIAGLNAGAYTVEATYAPTTPPGDFAASNSSIQQQVNPAQNSVNVTPTVPNFSQFGQPVQFTAVVTTQAPGQGSPTGSVTFVAKDLITSATTALGTVGLQADGPDASSTTSPATAGLAPDPYSITATYTNTDGNYVTGTTNTIAYFVAADSTTTVVSTLNNVNPSVFGQGVQFQATVTPAFAAGGTPVGSVLFFVNGNDPPTCNTTDPGFLGVTSLVNGVATTSLDSALPVGSDVISACYLSGSSDFGASSTQDPQYVQTVNSDPTTTALSSANQPGNAQAPSVFGQPIIFTADVTANTPGSGIPSGTVTFADGSNTLAVVNLSGNTGGNIATYETSSLAVGNHAITATYNPANDDYLTSVGGENQTVNQDPTTTTITQNSSSVQGQSISFTATVTANAPGAGVPTGSVEFFVNGADVFGGPVALTPGTPSTGSAATTSSIAALTPGTYQVTAVYSGDTNFLTSNETVGQIVQQAGTSTALTASPSGASLIFGTPVTLTAAVTPTGSGTGLPTGSVDFYDGTTLLGSAALSAVGGVQTAVLPATEYAVGNHSFSAVYVGEYDYTGSTSNTVTQSVGVISTATTLVSSGTPSSYSVPVTFTATVSPSSNAGPGPGGSVTFADGSTTLATVPVALSGGTYTASFTDAALAIGTHSITASYSGSTAYGASASAAVSQVVNRDGTKVTAQPTTNATMTATLTSAQGAALSGQTLTFTAGTGSNLQTLCTGTTNASGTASCSVTGLKQIFLASQGTYLATFAGNTDYAGSSGSAKS